MVSSSHRLPELRQHKILHPFILHQKGKLHGANKQLRRPFHAQIRKIRIKNHPFVLLKGQVHYRIDHTEQWSAILRYLQPQTQESLRD